MIDRNSCTVKTLSAVLDISSERVMIAMEASLGRELNEGVPSSVWKEFLEQNFSKVNVMGCGSVSKVVSTLSRLPGSYIINVKGHTFALVNGQVFDSARTNPTNRVLSVYRVK